MEGTEQYMRSCQWVARLKELRGGSNQWKDLVEMGSVFRFLKDKYCLFPLKGRQEFLQRGQDLCKGTMRGMNSLIQESLQSHTPRDSSS